MTQETGPYELLHVSLGWCLEYAWCCCTKSKTQSCVCVCVCLSTCGLYFKNKLLETEEQK